MLTPFGKELRKLRIDRELTLGDLAKQLDVSAAFLSAVETGRKKVPEGMVKDIAAKLKLSGADLTRLKEAAEGSPVTVRIELSGADTQSRKLAVAFARQFKSLTDSQVLQFHRLLAKKEQA